MLLSFLHLFDFEFAAARSTIGAHQGHQACERFDQSFLVDDDVIHAIVVAVDPRPNDVLVEISPGLGAPMVSLIEHVRTLQVVELDRGLIARSQQRFGDRLITHVGDALAFGFGSLQEVGRPLHTVGNLLYNIPSPLLFHLATLVGRVRNQYFMLQKEMVDRMVIAPGSKTFSQLSVTLQMRYYVELMLGMSPGSFNLPPKVDSAVVRIIPWPVDRPPCAPVDLRTPGMMVTMAFPQHHKVLRSTLGVLHDVIGFKALDFDLGRRAEEVSVEDFVAVANALPANRIAGNASGPSED